MTDATDLQKLCYEARLEMLETEMLNAKRVWEESQSNTVAQTIYLVAKLLYNAEWAAYDAFMKYHGLGENDGQQNANS